jgi:hypothetical protein
MSIKAIRLCIPGLAALLMATPCGAVQWHEIKENLDTGATVSVDESSVHGKDYMAWGWVRVDFPVPRERDGFNLKGYAAEWQANCRNHTYWPSQSLGFRPDEAAPVMLYNTSQQWFSPIPGSDEDAAMDALCEETKSIVGKVIDKGGELFHQYVEGIK